MNRVLTGLFSGAFLFMIGPITARGQQLPEGEGKQLVQNLCTSCHETNMITRSSGYSREDWQELIQSMVNLSGNAAGDTITKYLATHFPAGTELKPNLGRGEESKTFREWKGRELRKRARDPLDGPDATSVWAG